jgi:hypothetical protein
VKDLTLEGVNKNYQGCTNVISTGTLPFVTDALCSVCARGRYSSFPCNDTRACNCSVRVAVNPNAIGSNLAVFLPSELAPSTSNSWAIPVFASIAAVAVLVAVAFLGLKKYLAAKATAKRPAPPQKPAVDPETGRPEDFENPMEPEGSNAIVVHDNDRARFREMRISSVAYDEIEG